MSGPILVTCATGRQGRAAIRALLNLSNPPKTILAVTRSTASAGAQKLASTSASIKLVQGDLDDVPKLFDDAQKVAGEAVWDVHSIQLPQNMGIANESQQGKAMVDESLARGVRHFVYSSVDRGGEERSWTNRTEIPHFATKHDVELHLRDRAKGTPMSWTILRPVAFMDNLEPGMQSRVFLAALKSTFDAKKTLQWIAVRDIGVFAARAFEQPEEFNGKAIGLAGDDLTPDQLSEAFKAVTGKALLPTFSFLGVALKRFSAELREMIDWFAAEGYGVDVEALRTAHPGLMDLKTWIKEESKFV